MTPAEAELITENYFKKHDLIFEGAYPIIRGKEKELHIYVMGPKGRFMMKMSNTGLLFSQNSTRTNWIEIKDY
jgi:hypothetical protein